MARKWRGSALDLLGKRRPGDDRAKTGIYEEAPVPSAPPVVYRQSPYDWNTLWGAAATGYTRILAGMLERGTPPDFPDPQGRTALMYAADFGKTDAVCLLLAAGAEPNRRDRDGRTALFYLDARRFRETLNALVNGGAHLNVTDRSGGTPLIGAILDGNYDRTRALLEAGADPNVPDAYGIQPVDIATRYGRSRLVELLRDFGGRLSSEQNTVPVSLWLPPVPARPDP
jgi:uncharacterized protein